MECFGGGEDDGCYGGGGLLVELMMLVEGVREEQRLEIEQMGWVLVAHL